MPALTRLRIEALAQLADELRFSPKPTLLAQLARAEALVWTLEPAQAYPEEWVIFQITRHRVERAEPALILGAALQGELSAFVERVSHDAALTPAHAPPGALRLPALRERWRVSARTIERWRRQGLIARRERLPDGKSRLVFSRASVEGFETRCAARLERARRRSRIGAAESAAIAQEAARLRAASEGSTRNAIAAAIAGASPRSRSTIRAHLASQASQRGEPPFAEPPPLDRAAAQRIRRGLRRGATVAELSRALGRSAAAIRRADRLARLSRLRTCAARAPLAAAAAVQRPLGDAIVAGQSLNAPQPTFEATLGAFLAEAAAAPQPPDGAREAALAGAHRDLVCAAARALREIDPLHPPESTLDEIETALRLAWRLRCKLVRMQLRVVRAALEERLEGSLADIAPTQVVRLHLLAMRAACFAAARFDPGRGGRLSAPTAIALARTLAPATRTLRAAVGRARRADIHATRLSNWTLRAARWAPALAHPAQILAGLSRLGPDQRELLRLRLGLEGEPPHTKAQLAERLGLPAHVIARSEREALAAAARLA